VRLRPYQNGPTCLIDVQQIIPLPEANDYQVQVREKEQEGKIKRAKRYDERLRFWQGLISVARAHNARHATIKPGSYNWTGASSGTRGLVFNYRIGQEDATVELYSDRRDKTENKRIFDAIHSQKESIEGAFGDKLSWERLDGKRACRIQYLLPHGGYRTP